MKPKNRFKGIAEDRENKYLGKSETEKTNIVMSVLSKTRVNNKCPVAE